MRHLMLALMWLAVSLMLMAGAAQAEPRAYPEAGETAKGDPAMSVVPGSGKSFRDQLKDGRECAFCPEMVVVPVGGFLMGSPESRGARDSEEGPQTSVKFAKALAVGQHPVTRGQFRAFAADTKRDMTSWCWVLTATASAYEHQADKGWLATGFAQDDTHPVVCVSWQDAADFAAWLSVKTGRTYRLLSEAEREYATRAGSTTRYHFGDAISDGQANFGRKNGGTTRIGSFAAHGNRWGLHDVHGNVWDWTADCWNDSHAGAARDGAARASGDCSRRVVRGGSWSLEPQFLRATFRFWFPTGFRFDFIGFRLARVLDP